jgi:hypothetical protein
MIKNASFNAAMPNEAEQSPAPVRSDPPRDAAQIGSVCWRPAREIDLGQWLECGRKLGMVGRNVAWWIGDWLQYGNECFGERYPRAAKVTGYDVQSLMNMAWVASRFEPARRRGGLSWSHHAEVAALAPDEQDRWLDRAAQERMSVRCLRTELRTMRRVGAVADNAEPPERTALVCPHCGSRVARERHA